MVALTPSTHLPLILFIVVCTTVFLLITPSLTTIHGIHHPYSHSYSHSYSNTNANFNRNRNLFHRQKQQTSFLLRLQTLYDRHVQQSLPLFQPKLSPSTLTHPKPYNNTIRHELQTLLNRVNHTLLGNPKTTKQFILYRAIGNDLPPRHGRGQAYENVKFMLENEQTFDNLDIRWFLNRIVDEAELLRIVKLLVKHQQIFVIDYFDYDMFQQVDINLFGFKPVDVLRANFFYRNDSLSNHARREIKDGIFNPMNHFIIHNNQARNKMLAYGIETNAKYILPWDGNCFLTKTAWANITTTINFLDNDIIISTADTSTNHAPYHKFTTDMKKKQTSKYYYVPMVRITDNKQLLNSSYTPDTIDEEPQLIFRHDARERFNESLAYGCRPKVQLLWRLRVPGWWNKRLKHPSMCMSYDRTLQQNDVPLNMRIAAAGWVARLFSGVAYLEVDGAISLRGGTRSDAIEVATASTMAVIGRKYTDFNLTKSKLVMYDERVIQAHLDRIRNGDGDGKVKQFILNQLLPAASITSLSSNQLQPGRKLIILMFKALFTGRSSDFRIVTQQTRNLFINPTTRLHPLNDNIFNNEGGVDLCLMLDAIKLLKRSTSHPLTPADLLSIDQWVNQRAWWITGAVGNSTLSVDDYYASNWRATVHDVQAACLAAYTGDAVTVLRHTLFARGRMMSQFRHPSALWRDGLRGVLAWVVLAGISERVGGANGVDIWTFRNSSSSSASVANTYLLANASQGILPLALKAATYNRLIQLNYQSSTGIGTDAVDGGADAIRAGAGQGGLVSNWPWEEEHCAARACQYMIHHAYRKRNISLLMNVSSSTATTAGEDDDGHELTSVLDEDPCVEGVQNFIPPFWNLGVDDGNM